MNTHPVVSGLILHPILVEIERTTTLIIEEKRPWRALIRGLINPREVIPGRASWVRRFSSCPLIPGKGWTTTSNLSQRWHGLSYMNEHGNMCCLFFPINTRRHPAHPVSGLILHPIAIERTAINNTRGPMMELIRGFINPGECYSWEGDLRVESKSTSLVRQHLPGSTG